MGGQPTTEQHQTTEMTPEQKSFYSMAFPFAQEFASKPMQTFGGETVAGFQPSEVQGQNMALSTAAPGGVMGTTLGSAANANQMTTNPAFMLDPASNPFFTKSMQNMADITTKELTEKELPALRQQEVGAGGAMSGGDTRSGVAGALATERTNRAISDAITSGYSNLYQTGLQGMMTGVGQAPGTATSQLLPALAYSGTGAQTRSLEQQKIDEAVQKFYTGEQMPFLQSADLMSLIQGIPGSQTDATAKGAAPTSNPLQMMSSLGALGMGLFGNQGLTGALGGGAGLGSIFSGIGSGIGSAFSGMGSGLSSMLPFLAMA